LDWEADIVVRVEGGGGRVELCGPDGEVAMNTVDWSVIVEDFEWLGDGRAAPTATVWRKYLGFAEQTETGDDRRFCGAGSMLYWLARGSPNIRLVLLFKVGGRYRSQAWLGLTVAGATIASARSQVREVAPDLGQALDAWGVFPESGGRGPRIPRDSVGVVASGEHRTSQGSAEEPEFFTRFQGLNGLHHPISLRLEVRPAGLPAGLIEGIDDAGYRCAALSRRFQPHPFLPGSLDGCLRDLEDLRDQALACQVRISLHGANLGSLVRQWVVGAFADYLGMSLRLEPGQGDLLWVPGAVVHGLLKEIGTASPSKQIWATAHPVGRSLHGQET